ncbi:MAG: endolytic transglycosylase MltG, partial [Eubacteriales bacterium]|nr:endolytic transglycosylase MltG [Eubacteriales bacterium]
NSDGTSGTKTISSIDPEYFASALKDAGLIQYKWLFSFYCGLSNAYTKVDPGDYKLKSSFDYRALVQNMRKGVGGMKTVDVTIPEGFTMRDIFMKFDENDVASYDELVDSANSGIFKYDFLDGTEDYGASRLEGYLFPDTYQFYVGTEPSTAINKLLNEFNDKFTPEMISKAHELGYSIKDIVTIASIIEKEAKLDEDRAYVASVIYNRLKTGMSLGMDTTILYLFPDHEGEPTQEMLNTDSPYNTHIYTGFPPTPICNPGLESINAALAPADSNYLYFYADIESGKLNFFTNYDEFNNYVQSHRNQAS